jgi:hypothetical protein
LTAGIIAGCSIKSPTAPSWEVVLSLPLSDHWFSLESIFREAESENFQAMGVDRIYTVIEKESLDRFEVEDQITLDPIDESVSREIGTFTVPAQETQTTSLSLFTMYPTLPTGGSVPVPADSFPAVAADIPVFGSFTQVTIASGDVTVRLTNDTRLEYDVLEVRRLDDTAAGALVLTVDMIGTSGNLVDAETRTVIEPLDGLALSSDLSLEVLGHTIGGTVTLVGTEGFDLEVELSDLQVDSVTGRVDPIDYSFSESITFADPAQVQSVALAGGTLTLELDNQLPVPLQLSIQLPEFEDSLGNPVSPTLNAAAGLFDSDVRGLVGHTIMPTQTAPDTLTLTVDVTVHSDGSGPGTVTLASTDSVTVRAALADLVVESVTGVLDPRIVTIEPDSVEIEEEGNLLDELRKVDLTAIELALEVRSTIDFPAQLTLDIEGEGGVPAYVPLSLDLTLPASSIQDTTFFVFNETNTPALIDLLNAIPTLIRFSGEASVGDDAHVGTVSSTSYIEVDVSFRVPVLLEVNQTIDYESDKEFNDEGLVDDEDEESVQFLEASLTYRLSSSMGLPLTARWVVARDSAVLYTDPEIELQLRIFADPAAAADTTIVLSSADWEILKEPHWMGAKITIPPTATPIRMSESDSIRARVAAEVKVLIDPEGNGGEGGGK